MAEGKASQEALKRVWHYPSREEHPEAEVFVFDAWCKSCGICTAFCPTGVFTSDKSGRPIVANPDKCIVCGLCEIMCPDMAITVYKERKKKGASSDDGAKPDDGPGGGQA
jgi:2-oxoglutarate ferredoxin oxidoreductase subunit delta